MWTGPESNRRHTAFQAVALPTELPVQNKYHKILRTGATPDLSGCTTYCLTASPVATCPC